MDRRLVVPGENDPQPRPGGFMHTKRRRQPRRCAAPIFVLASLAGLLPGVAPAGTDVLFSDSAEAAVTLAGRAVGPQPLANAAVEVRVGTRIFTTTADASGNFSLFVNTLFDGGDVIDVVARGTGAQSSVAWRTAPGPIDDAQRRAGADGILSRDEDPFVDATPRSTAVASALQLAGNGTLPRGSAAFERSARALQWLYIDALAAMLQLYGEGLAPLPSNVADTVAAVDGIVRVQAAYRDWTDRNSFSPPCTVQPEPPVCRAARLVRTDPAIAPAEPVPQDENLTRYFGWWNTSATQDSVRFGATTADLWTLDGARTAAVPVTADSGAYTVRVGFADRRALRSVDSFVVPPGGGSQVLQRREVYAYHYRFARAPGGQRLSAVGESFRNRYPNNPNLPDEDFPVGALGGIALAVAEGALPAALGTPPPIAGQRLLLPIGKAPAAGSGWLLEYDVAQLSAGGAVTFERSPVTASFTLTNDPWTLTLQVADAPAVEQQITLVNEERPGVWRVRVSAREQGAGAPSLFGIGLLSLALPASEGFVPADFPASWDASVNSHLCSGPLGRIEDLTPQGQFANCFPRFGYNLAVGGGGTNFTGGSLLPLTWTLPGGVDTGRLRVDRLNAAGTSVSNRRAWQVVRKGASDWLVLENVSFSPPTPPPLPPFVRSSRLVIFSRLP